MTTANAKNLASLRERWQGDPMIPRWKKDGMILLAHKLEARVRNSEDAHDKVRVELYYPEDCTNYDVFMTVSCALEARVLARADGGLVMKHFGKCPEFRGIV